MLKNIIDLHLKFEVDAVYAMAHSLHNLVLDVCCNNTMFYQTREEALKVTIIFWLISKNTISRKLLMVENMITEL